MLRGSRCYVSNPTVLRTSSKTWGPGGPLPGPPPWQGPGMRRRFPQGQRRRWAGACAVVPGDRTTGGMASKAPARAGGRVHLARGRRRRLAREDEGRPGVGLAGRVHVRACAASRLGSRAAGARQGGGDARGQRDLARTPERACSGSRRSSAPIAGGLWRSARRADGSSRTAPSRCRTSAPSA
jgi:hypothetical protein